MPPAFLHFLSSSKPPLSHHLNRTPSARLFTMSQYGQAEKTSFAFDTKNGDDKFFDDNAHQIVTTAGQFLTEKYDFCA